MILIEDLFFTFCDLFRYLYWFFFSFEDLFLLGMFLSPNQVGFEVIEAFAELSGILIKTINFWYNF
jgi:hypothetical protein